MRAMGPHDLLALLYAHDTIFNVLLLFLFCLAIYVFDYPEGDNFKVARSSRRSLHRAPDASASAAAAKPAGSTPAAAAAAAAAAVVTGAGARAAAAKRCAVDARRSGSRLARARPPARASRQLARHPAAPRFLARPPTARFLLARHPHAPPPLPPPPLDLPRPRPLPAPAHAPALCAAPRPFAAPLSTLESGDEATDRSREARQ